MRAAPSRATFPVAGWAVALAMLAIVPASALFALRADSPSSNLGHAPSNAVPTAGSMVRHAPSPVRSGAPPTMRAPVVPAAPAARRPSAGGAIDPLKGYSSEPAPMGIADFGVTGRGGGARA